MDYSYLLLLIITGLLAGFVSGGLGVGGGIVIIPALIFLAGFTQHQAQGTSLFVLMAPVVAVSVFNYYKEGHVNVKAALIIMATFVVGSYFGSKLAINVPDKILKKAFGILMIIGALKMIFSK